MVLVTLLSALLTFCMHKVLKTKDHHTIPSSALIWKYFSLTMYITIYRKWKIIILQLFLLCRGTWRSWRNGMQNRIFIRVSIFSWSGMLQSEWFIHKFIKKKIVCVYKYTCVHNVLFVFYGTYTMGQSTIIVACSLSVLCTTPLATKV